jgi:alpha-D-ribose 1-methylphosphonate 5-triphosphate synthase subunit PhnG
LENMSMNGPSIIRRKTVAIASVGLLGAGLLGGVAFGAAPTSADAVAMTTPSSATGSSTDATADKARARLKAVLDALVAKNVITQSQEDAIIGALTSAASHPKLREFVGDVATESVSYLGLPADQVKQQLRSGKSLGEIADGTAGKSRTGLLGDLDAKAGQKIQAAVAAGKLTQAQADQLTPKVHDAIVKVVDHTGSPKPIATN